MKKLWNAVLFVALSFCGIVMAGETELSKGISYDHRGMLYFGKLISTNVVGFANGWKYAAQDLSLTGLTTAEVKKKTVLSGVFDVSGNSLNFRQEMKADGKGGLKLLYHVDSPTEAKLESLYVVFHLPVSFFGGNKLFIDTQKKGVELPETSGNEYIIPGENKTTKVAVKCKECALTLSADKGKPFSVSLVDGRAKNNDSFEIRLFFPDYKNLTSSDLAIEVSFKDKRK